MGVQARKRRVCRAVARDPLAGHPPPFFLFATSVLDIVASLREAERVVRFGF